jgi:hypothetical protein
MKKHFIILSILAVAMACSPQEMRLPDDAGDGSEITLNACFEDVSTRTTLVDGTKVYWRPGDAIKVFAGASSSARFTTGITEASAECGFTGTFIKSDSYLAFYPYQNDVTYDGRYITANLPSTQEAVGGNVKDVYLYSAGDTSADGKILFRNLLSGICFSLDSEGVTYVELKGHAEEPVAGGLKVTIGKDAVKAEAAAGRETAVRLNAPGGSFTPGVFYYLVCIPTVFEKGFTLRMVKADGSEAVFKTDGSVDLKRSVFGRIAHADAGQAYLTPGFPEGELPGDNEIWYTTLDNKPLTEISDQPGSALVSHTYERGMGVLRFSGPLTQVSRLSQNGEELERLTGILVPDCVEYIGDRFFWESPKIREFRVPAGLQGARAFTSHTQMALERLYGHHVSEDGRCIIIDGVLYAFASAGLTSYEVPAGVVRISSGAFAMTRELKSVVLPSGLTMLEQSCFSQSALESVYLPASIQSIDTYAFSECRNLKELLGDSKFISPDRKFLSDPYAMYGNMLFLFAGKEDTSYEIPEEVQAIENYAFVGCDHLKSLTFSHDLLFVAGDAFAECYSLEAFYGPHTTPDHKGLTNGEGLLQFIVPTISGDYAVPDEVTALGDHIFASKPQLRSVTMGDQVTTIGIYAFAFSPELRSVTLSANLVSIDSNPFQFSEKLESVYFRSILPPTITTIEETGNPVVSFYVPSQAYRLYTSDPVWKPYREVMKAHDYPDLPEPDFYLSSDYSREGEVTAYQRASAGNGIDIVFMGDAYSDREVENGKYLKDMKACVEEYFAIEPYKSFRDLFNIYIVTTVSATEGYAHGGRSLGTYLGYGTVMGGNDEKCFKLARRAVGDDKRMEEVLVVVCGNQDLSGPIRLSGTCYFYEPEVWAGHDYACGPAVTYFLKTDENLVDTGDVLRHESGGHGFAKLADEYHYSGNVPYEERLHVSEVSQYMWYSNVDFTSDPAQVKWAPFLADARYQNEVGLFEGGLTYMYGVWRPSENSIMNDNQGGFNAPSRYTIWYRIHKLAYGSGWNGTFEDFATYDAINRKAAPASSSRRNLVEKPKQKLPAPVVTGRTWRQAAGL